MNQERLAKVLTKMKEDKVPQLLISDPTTIFYLTGKMIHPGERILVLILKETGDHALVIAKIFPIADDLDIKMDFVADTEDGVARVLTHLDASQTIGVDKNWPAHFLLDLMEKSGSTNFVNGSKITDGVRAIKDEDEIELMRQASASNDEAMARLQALIPEELTELTMSDKLMDIYRELGNSDIAFSPIVAYGANGADPHHETDHSVVKEGDSIILDIGGVKNGYCSDMTRTVFYKSVPEKSREVFETVLEANKRAIALVKPGVKMSEIDAAARDYITEKGYGEYFTHRTGHFIGIECHEAGDVSGINDTVAEPGMIFSVEPGIYIPGEVGVRIEDLIVVTEDGHENLNKHPKELTIIG